MDSDSDFKSIFPMFRSFFVFCLFFWALGFNVYMWNKAHINYKLVFQFTYHYSDMISILRRAAVFTAIFVLMYLCYIIHRTMPELSTTIDIIPLEITPLVCWLALLIYIFSPFKGFFNYEGRMYMFKIFIESMASIFIHIEFKHVWFTDQLTSLIGPIRDLEYTFCYYVHYNNSLEDKKLICHSKRGIVLFIGCFPHLIRILQCIRIIYDTKTTYPTIINLLKYSFAVSVAVISFLGSTSLLYTLMWITVATASTVLSFYWDVKNDFGLGDSSHNYLRSQLSYKRKWFYFVVVSANLVLRFVWVLSMSPEIVHQFIRPELFSLIVFSLEIIRRSLWNCIRVEYKHIEICKQHKISMNVELPFKKDEKGKLYLKDSGIVGFVKMNQRLQRLSSRFIDSCLNKESNEEISKRPAFKRADTDQEMKHKLDNYIKEHNI